VQGFATKIVLGRAFVKDFPGIYVATTHGYLLQLEISNAEGYHFNVNKQLLQIDGECQ
jgi:hypothetical protein